MIYNSQPPKANRAACRAWTAFYTAIGCEPKDMTWGHGSACGWAWTATDRATSIWVWSPLWSKAIKAHDGNPEVGFMGIAHRGGDEIDRTQDAMMNRLYSQAMGEDGNLPTN